MKLEVLGCSGGIGKGLKTTSLLVNDEWLVDAGTGIGELARERLQSLKGIFLTHAHMDHICCLPMLLPIVNHPRSEPFRIFARPEVIQGLQQHIFNEFIWPDFTKIPTPETSQIEFIELDANSPVTVSSEGELTVTGVPVNHPTPAYGYIFASASAAVAFTGDCHDSPSFWQKLAQQPGLKTVLVDLSFPENYQAVADISGHYTPASLHKDLVDWPEQTAKPEIAISHLKPGFEQAILQEAADLLGSWSLTTIQVGDVIEF